MAGNSRGQVPPVQSAGQYHPLVHPPGTHGLRGVCATPLRPSRCGAAETRVPISGREGAPRALSVPNSRPRLRSWPRAGGPEQHHARTHIHIHTHKHNRQRRRRRMSTTSHRLMYILLHRPEHRGRGQPKPPTGNHRRRERRGAARRRPDLTAIPAQAGNDSAGSTSDVAP